jgi:epoxyqueuosine reductase
VPYAPLDSLIDHALSQQIKDKALALGFDLAGIAPADPSHFRGYFREWLDDGQAGEMQYLSNRFDERTQLDRYLPGAQSVICVAINYHVPLQPLAEADQPHHGRIARYALGDDYHEFMKGRLHALADWIKQAVPDAQTRACVDTAPVMEKEVAARAGIGWLGKNSCLISPKVGSWLLLGEIVTTIGIPPDVPATDHCGSCTRCIDACPTNAITAPYQLDARKCISYLTIEHRGPIPANLEPQMGNWLYGCDICQDVCPHNRKAPATDDPALQPRFSTGTLYLPEISNWSAEEYRRQFRGSAMRRVKLPVLQRNARIALCNLKRESDASPFEQDKSLSKGTGE